MKCIAQLHISRIMESIVTLALGHSVCCHRSINTAAFPPLGSVTALSSYLSCRTRSHPLLSAHAVSFRAYVGCSPERAPACTVAEIFDVVLEYMKDQELFRLGIHRCNHSATSVASNAAWRAAFATKDTVVVSHAPAALNVLHQLPSCRRREALLQPRAGPYPLPHRGET